MKVSEVLTNGWNELKEKGDNEKIGKLLNLKSGSVANLFSTGEMTPHQIKVIARFYKAKRSELKKLEQDQD